MNTKEKKCPDFPSICKLSEFFFKGHHSITLIFLVLYVEHILDIICIHFFYIFIIICYDDSTGGGRWQLGWRGLFYETIYFPVGKIAEKTVCRSV